MHVLIQTNNTDYRRGEFFLENKTAPVKRFGSNRGWHLLLSRILGLDIPLCSVSPKMECQWGGGTKRGAAIQSHLFWSWNIVPQGEPWSFVLPISAVAQSNQSFVRGKSEAKIFPLFPFFYITQLNPFVIYFFLLWSYTYCRFWEKLDSSGV